MEHQWVNLDDEVEWCSYCGTVRHFPIWEREEMTPYFSISCNDR